MNEEQMTEALEVPIEKEKRIKKICGKCGSEDVLIDAYAQWNVEKQDFVLNCTFEHSFCFCNKCQGECGIIDVEVKDE